MPFVLRKLIFYIVTANTIKVVQGEKSYLSRYMPGAFESNSVLVEHEVLSASFAERARHETAFWRKGILRLRSLKKRVEEKKWYRRFKKIVVFTEYDKKIIGDNYKIKDIEVIPLGIDLDAYSQASAQEKKYDLLFVGNFSHMPNVDGASYFYRSIFQLVKKEFPHLKVVFCGANPSEEILRLSKMDKSILVTGYVDDVREYYVKSKVFIAPIRYGTGMRYKILEAMAMGVPVVTTSVGARGIDEQSICIADTPQEFADRVIELLNNPQKRQDISEKARITVKECYSWDRLIPRYEAIYRSLMEGES